MVRKPSRELLKVQNLTDSSDEENAKFSTSKRSQASKRSRLSELKGCPQDQGQVGCNNFIVDLKILKAILILFLSIFLSFEILFQLVSVHYFNFLGSCSIIYSVSLTVMQFYLFPNYYLSS